MRPLSLCWGCDTTHDRWSAKTLSRLLQLFVKACREGKDSDYTMKSRRNTKPGTKQQQEWYTEANWYTCTSYPETTPKYSTSTEVSKVQSQMSMTPTQIVSLFIMPNFSPTLQRHIQLALHSLSIELQVWYYEDIH